MGPRFTKLGGADAHPGVDQRVLDARPRRPSNKRLGSLAVLFAALAAILGFSVAGALRQERRVLDEFAFGIRQQVHASAQELATRLGSLDQDARMLADLVERSRVHDDRGHGEGDAGSRACESAFRALAVVVDPYRLIAFVLPDGKTAVMAPDPREDGATIAAVESATRRFGAGVSLAGRARLDDAFPYRDRWFFLYSVPVRGGGAIVIASDEVSFLGPLTGTHLGSAHLYVRDPSGALWADCDTRTHCHRAATGENVVARASVNTTMAQVWPVTLTSLGFGTAPLIELSEEIARPTGNWSVAWTASSEGIVRHESDLLHRIVFTSIAAALAVVGVGGMILRQQRQTLALEGQLRYAEAMANARNLETQLVRADKLVTVGVLSAELAHEIGSPMAVIRGRAEQVLRSTTSPVRAEDLRVIIKHIDRIASTMRHLLDFSRRPAADKQPVALDVVVERTRGLMQWKLDATGVGLDVDLDPHLPLLMADADQLQQVLVNLLLNACDASRRGGIVLMRARQEQDGMASIAIVDYGVGIAPALVETVFEPFFTTKKRGEGTGLGLPIAASIVRDHGGRIELESILGAGTTVMLCWPAAEAQVAHG